MKRSEKITIKEIDEVKSHICKYLKKLGYTEKGIKENFKFSWEV